MGSLRAAIKMAKMRVAGSNQRTVGGRFSATLGLLGLAFLASCAGGPGSPPPPDGLEARLQASNPLHPAFERFLDQEPDLFESLLAIDSFVHPQIDQAAVRRAFDGLCSEA